MLADTTHSHRNGEFLFCVLCNLLALALFKRNALRGLLDLRTLLVSDAHTTEDQTQWGAPPPADVIAHTNLYWSFERAPGRTAGTAAAKDVTFARDR